MLTADIDCEFATPDPPSVAFKNDVAISLDEAGQATLDDSDTYTDANATCGFSVETSQSAFTCEHIGTSTIDAIASDVSGNSVSSTLNVHVEDQLPPELTTQPLDVALDCTCNAQLDETVFRVSDSMAYSCGIVFARDNCFVDTIEISPTHFTGDDAFTVNVFVNVTDGSGNMASTVAIVNLLDNIPPSFTSVVPNYTAILEGNPGTTTLTLENLEIEATDNCNFTIELSRETLVCDDLGTMTVTATVTDRDGNTDTVDIDVTVLDVDEPVILNAINITESLDEDGFVDIDPSDIILDAEDNCEIDEKQLTESSFSCSDIGVNSITASVIDTSGNTQSIPATVTVVDDSSPTLSPTSIIVTLDGAGAGSVSIDDSGAPSILVSDNCDVDSFSPSSNSYDCDDLGTSSFTITAEDVNSNSISESITVMVQDITPPTFTVLNDITVDLSPDSVIVSVGDVADAIDNCNVDVIVLGQTTFDCTHRGVNTVNVVAYDTEGNSASETVEITVRDVDDPTMVLQSHTAELDFASSVSISANDLIVNADDNCDSNELEVNVSPSSFGCSSIGSSPNTVTVTITDTSGNSATDTDEVTVVDVSPPEIIPTTHTLSLNASGQATLNPLSVVTSVIDNCDNDPEVSVSPNLFTCDDIGTETVTITASDVYSNSDSATTTVTIEDNMDPLLTTFTSRNRPLNSQGTHTVIPSDTIESDSDNCEIANREVAGDTFYTCDDIGFPRTITTTITDTSGNTATGTTSLGVVDTSSPSISTIVSFTAPLNQDGIFFLSKEELVTNTDDNCEVDRIVLSRTSVDCSNAGDLVQILATVNDTSGNEATASIFVNVVDGISPSIQLETDQFIVSLNASGMFTFDVDDFVADSWDNCEVEDITLTPPTVTCDDLGDKSVTVRAIDPSGNTATSSVTVDVRDDDNVCVL